MEYLCIDSRPDSSRMKGPTYKARATYLSLKKQQLLTCAFGVLDSGDISRSRNTKIMQKKYFYSFITLAVR